MDGKIALGSRNLELLLLLAIGLGLAAGGRYAARHHIVAVAKAAPAVDAGSPIHLLRCSPDELRSVLARRLADPELSRAHQGILAWRKGIRPGRLDAVLLSDISRLAAASGPADAAASPPPVPLLAAAVYHGLRPYWIVRDPETAHENWNFYLGLLLACFLAVHLVLRLSGSRGSQFLLPPALILCGVSAILLFTFTDPLRDRLLYPPFVHGVALGCAALIVSARFVRLQVLESYRYVMILAASALSLLLIFLGTGPAGSDARINLFGFFQPVEFIKLLVALFLASYFAGKDVELRRLDAYRWMGLSLPRWRDILPVAAFLAATLALFFRQKDLGPALIVYLVFLCMFVITSRRILLGLAGLALLISAFWASYRYQLLQTVATRIEMWLSPWDNHRPGGVQLAESLWALASGGFRGAGLGRGDPQYIPAGHTDLILSAAGEALGFPGLAAILVVLSLLFCAALYAAWRARTAYAAYLGFCLALLLGIQTAVIAAGTVGLIPLTGVPLPFMSYGKSALVAHFFLLGLMLNLSSAVEEPAAPRRRISRAGHGDSGHCPGRPGRRGRQGFSRDVPRCGRDPLPRIAHAASRRRAALQLQPPHPRPRGPHHSRQHSRPHGIPACHQPRSRAATHAEAMRGLGIELPLQAADRRIYVLGPAAVQLLGHTGAYWTDPKTVERLADERLRGYPQLPGGDPGRGSQGRKTRLLRARSCIPRPFPRRGRPAGGSCSSAPEDVRLTLDAHMQWAALKALEANLPTIDGVRRNRGAAVVLEAATGAILACVSLPGYDPNALQDIDLDLVYGAENKAAYDRARFEIYPPDPPSKLLSLPPLSRAAGWKRRPPDRPWSAVTRARSPGSTRGAKHRRHVTDDEAESAHGRIDLERALVESCNVYFAWLGTRLGAARLFEFARNRFRLELKGVASAAGLEPNLPDNAYGQAKITVSPLKMAAVAAAVVNGGLA